MKVPLLYYFMLSNLKLHKKESVLFQEIHKATFYHTDKIHQTVSSNWKSNQATVWWFCGAWSHALAPTFSIFLLFFLFLFLLFFLPFLHRHISLSLFLSLLVFLFYLIPSLKLLMLCCACILSALCCNVWWLSLTWSIPDGDL